MILSFTVEKENSRKTEQEAGGGSELAQPGWKTEDKPPGSKAGLYLNRTMSSSLYNVSFSPTYHIVLFCVI